MTGDRIQVGTAKQVGYTSSTHRYTEIVRRTLHPPASLASFIGGAIKLF